MKIVSNEEIAVGDMQGSLLERQALPIGATQFEEWSDRIIKAAGVEASIRSQKNALAVMLMHLGPTEAFKQDAYFALALRKAAVQETAHFIMVKYQDEIKSERAAEKLAEDTAAKIKAADGLLEIKTV